ncbi:DUF559 domain-containing protein [Agromyces seonyuensis]|uniref:DUF559 domain-containing protein n=1 Tax=Agromyces seonyuensis TaxID=2662446 RepID=A0A6I4P7U2_9MICO|nr:DUF559 domain-containing protein [Agromyces seonyuensis]MWB99954.1 DUF559 domain-containing protein [Agromyces seonyuensis]
MRRPAPLPHPFDAAPFSTAAALRAAISEGRLRSGDLVRPFHGVRSPTAATNVHDEARSYAVGMTERRFFSHVTAARLLGLPLSGRLEADERLHVTSVGGRAPRGVGVVGHTTAERPKLVRLDGLPVLAPAEAWCSLGALATRDELVVAGDRLLGLPAPLATEEEIDTALAAHGSRRGARRLLAARADLRAGSHSPQETRTRLVLIRAGLPEPELNAAIVLRDGRVVVGDLVYRRWRVLVEYDGAQHRTDDRQWQRDVGRLNDLAADGWLVIRITRSTRAEDVVARTRRALHDRGWRP